jgi:hypothetical protein
MKRNREGTFFPCSEAGSDSLSSPRQILPLRTVSQGRRQDIHQTRAALPGKRHCLARVDKVECTLGVNSRSVARRTVSELGWKSNRTDIIEDIRHGSYRERFGSRPA